MVTVMAKLTAKEGSQGDLEKVMGELVEQVKSEAGTVEYILNQSTTDPATFMVFEVYKDKAALNFHGSTDYFKAFMKESAALLAAKPEIEIFREVARK